MTCRRTSRPSSARAPTSRGALAALTVLIAGLVLDRERLAEACADPLLRATDAAEALVRDGVPFRDAHHQVAATVREGSFVPPAEQLPRLGDVGTAVAGGEEALVDMKAPLPVSLAGRDLLRITDLVPAEAEAILDLAAELKRDRTPIRPGLALGLVFDQPSTRTRISFAVAALQLGGGYVTLTPAEMQLSRGESLGDTGRVLSRYLDVIAIRVLAHAELEAWAEATSMPVINALTSVEHPCQALADALTIRERLGGLEGVKIGWVGDGTNVLVSLAQLAALTGMQVTAACPQRLRAPSRHTAASSSPTRVTQPPAPTCSSPTSGSHSGRRTSATSGCATSSPTGSTPRWSRWPRPRRSCSTASPAHPGEEISAEVLYGERSAVWDEAENRLHVEKALLALLSGVATAPAQRRAPRSSSSSTAARSSPRAASRTYRW